MITLAQLEIYKSYLGDIDAYARLGSSKQRAVLDDGQWTIIQHLIDDIALLNSGYSSKEFSYSINRRIEEHCSSDEVITELQKLSLIKD